MWLRELLDVAANAWHLRHSRNGESAKLGPSLSTSAFNSRSHRRPRRSGSKATVLAIATLALLLVGAVLFVAYWPEPVERIPPPPKDIPKISADQLRREFKADLNAAIARYVGTYLIVDGRIIQYPGMLQDTGGEHEITLTGADESPNDFPWISCYITKQKLAKFPGAFVDHEVAVQGYCFKAVKDVIFLRNCELVEHRPKKKKE